LNSFDVYIVKKEDFDKNEIKEAIDKGFTKLFGQVKIKCYFVDKIKREKGGKLRSIISHCKK